MQGVFAGRGPAVHAHRPDVPATAVQIVPKSFMSVQLSPLLQAPAKHTMTQACSNLKSQLQLLKVKMWHCVM